MTLSLIMPAYNESRHINEIVEKVVSIFESEGIQYELIIVNDCSHDETGAIADKLASRYTHVTALHNEKNMGKSQTVKKGILASQGDWVVIQDADLEYEPEDIIRLYQEVLRFSCDVGYGNRFGVDNGFIYKKNFYGNLLLSFFSNLCTIGRIRVDIPDMETCYKLIRGDVARELAHTIISTSNFGFEPEITAKLSRYTKSDLTHLKFCVIPIRYYPRSYGEGKKMKAFQDGTKALFEIIRFNFF